MHQLEETRYDNGEHEAWCEADRQLDDVRQRLDALEAKPPPAPATIAVPVAQLRAWQTMIRDVAYEIEFDGENRDRWIYNVGQAYADANVVAGEITDVLREVGGEP